MTMRSWGRRRWLVGLRAASFLLRRGRHRWRERECAVAQQRRNLYELRTRWSPTKRAASRKHSSPLLLPTATTPTDPMLRAAAAARLLAHEQQRCGYVKARGQASWRDGRPGHPDAGMNELQVNNLNACFEHLRSHHEELGVKWVLFPYIHRRVLTSSGTPCRRAKENHRRHRRRRRRRCRRGRCARCSRAATPSSPASHGRAPSSARPCTIAGRRKGWSSRTTSCRERSTRTSSPNPNWPPTSPFRDQPPVGRRALTWCTRFVNETLIQCRWDVEKEGLRVHHYVRSLEDYERKMKTGDTPLQVPSIPVVGAGPQRPDQPGGAASPAACGRSWPTSRSCCGSPTPGYRHGPRHGTRHRQGWGRCKKE